MTPSTAAPTSASASASASVKSTTTATAACFGNGCPSTCHHDDCTQQRYDRLIERVFHWWLLH